MAATKFTNIADAWSISGVDRRRCKALHAELCLSRAQSHGRTNQYMDRKHSLPKQVNTYIACSTPPDHGQTGSEGA